MQSVQKCSSHALFLSKLPEGVYHQHKVHIEKEEDGI